MIHIPNPSLRRRGLITGAAGMATTAAGLLAAAPVPVLAQPTAPAASGGGPSAVIDVNHARAAPIPIAIPDLGGAGRRLGPART